ncbi:cation/H(+) antiporter 15-like [Pyrus ussuriensis x Pyrus communis]|uniref:Cation/H(+) antiporter 15-like n=1 Tax=Pyrus ussuriensis x Pyrus communis TaxID=2448454 RepID=A0A5N5HHA5_9ROSA|nr:cation/H(+) antiporter 15-like [Pyrus ussuriensis x Pyrus communis]
MRTLETLGNLAIVYHMFLVGLELDFKPVIRSGKKTLSIAFARIIFSIPVGWVLHRYLLLKDFTEQTKIYKQNRNGPIFWGIALATTNFPDLARILTRFVICRHLRLVLLVSSSARNGSSQYDQYAAVGPFLAHVYKSSTRPSVQYKERNIESVGPETELRILACFHNSDKHYKKNELWASNPTNQSPIHVLIVCLVELTGHALAMLIVHDTCKTPTTKYTQLPDSSITSNGVFGNYARKRENITVQKLTAVSAYATKRKDICNLAEENQATLIIIPFHYDKSLTDGATQSISHLSSLNNNLIANAQCSVGAFVDHGFGKSNIITESNSDSDNDSSDDNSLGRNNYHFAMVFIGGTDDHEALTYAWRMPGHPHIRLTVIRINYRKKEVQISMDENKDGYDDGILKAMARTGMEEKLDHLYLDDFRLKSMNDPSIKLEEKMLTGWVETLKLINSMESEYDMYIVGRRHGDMSPSLKLLYFSDSDELGIVGDALVSSSFLACTSILVVQQSPFYLDEQVTRSK